MNRASLALAAAAFLLTARPCPAQDTMRYLDNGRVRVGIDLAQGGAITYLSRSGSSLSVVNIADAGREIQQSYYSGPNDFGNWAGQPWPWNPISVGDQWGNRSGVTTFRTDGRFLYTRVTPMQWGGSDPAGTPGDCDFENWVWLTGDIVHVRNRLNNARTDRTWYGAYGQELPAVYTIGRLHHLWSYNGTRPFQGDPPTELPAVFLWTSWRATESWAALIDDSGWGLGVYHPGVCLFLGGFFPQVDDNTIQAGPHDSPCGYISPVGTEILDWNIGFEYSYDLVLGTLDRIRSYVYAQQKPRLPAFVFSGSRSHWTYANASDGGWPIRLGLNMDVGRDDPQAIGPECAYQAAEVPTLYIRAAHHLDRPSAGQLIGQVFFELDNGAQPFSEERSVSFPVINDGAFHTYVVRLSGNPAYRGLVSRLRFDPVTSGRPGDTVDVLYLSKRTLGMPN